MIVLCPECFSDKISSPSCSFESSCICGWIGHYDNLIKYEDAENIIKNKKRTELIDKILE
jgi:hypothetical protein